MRRASLVAIAMVALGVLASGAWATTNYQYDNGHYGWSDATNPNSWYANIYTADEPAGFRLTGVQIYNLASPGQVEVNVWDVDTGLPASSRGLQLASLTTGWNTIDVSVLGLTFASGTQFAVGFKAKGGEHSPFAAYDNTGREGAISYRNAKGEDPAQAYGWEPFTPFRGGPDGSLMVRALGEKAPEPASLVLLGCAAGAGAWVRKRRGGRPCR